MLSADIHNRANICINKAMICSLSHDVGQLYNLLSAVEHILPGSVHETVAEVLVETVGVAGTCGSPTGRVVTCTMAGALSHSLPPSMSSYGQPETQQTHWYLPSLGLGKYIDKCVLISGIAKGVLSIGFNTTDSIFY